MASSGVRFIRKNGHIVPIHASTGAAVGSMRKYAPVKRVGAKAAALLGVAVGGAAAAITGSFKTGAKVGGVAALLGLTATNTRVAKGESRMHAAQRVSDLSRSKAKKTSV